MVQILQHTPVWVFVLFVALIALGLQQSRDRKIKPFVLLFVPLGMTALSYGSLVSSFGPQLALQLLWLAALLTAAAAIGAYLPVRRAQVHQGYVFVPGSWLPLGLMMVIFFAKYTVGVMSALAPELVKTTPFVLACTLVYGAFSGIFAGRALAIWRQGLANAA